MGIGQEVLRALRIAVDEVRAVDPLLDLPDERCRLRDGLPCDGGARNRFGRARGRQRPNHHAEREEPGDEPHADHPEPPATSLLAIRCPRDAARVLGSPPRDEREDPRQEREERPPDRRAHPLGRVSRRVEAAADRVGKGHRALVRQAGEWLGGANRLELVDRLGGGQLGDLDRQQAVRPGPAADGEDLLEVLDRRRRPHLGKRAPQLVHSHGLREVPADERDAVTGGHRAMPGERLDLDRLAERRRDPTAPDARILIGRRRRRRDLVHPRLADHDRARRTDLGDVRLPPANDDGDHADAGAARDAQPPSLVVEAPVGAPSAPSPARRGRPPRGRSSSRAGSRRAPRGPRRRASGFRSTAARGGRGCPSSAPGHRPPARGRRPRRTRRAAARRRMGARSLSRNGCSWRWPGSMRGACWQPGL